MSKIKDVEVDNIKLFKKLIKDEKGNTDILVFESLILNNFDSYRSLRLLSINDIKDFKIESAKKDSNYIKFRIEFKSKAVCKKFIELNENKEIKLKKTIYLPVFNIVKKNCVEIYFKKKVSWDSFFIYFLQTL